jgi:hypothetical protein
MAASGEGAIVVNRLRSIGVLAIALGGLVGCGESSQSEDLKALRSEVADLRTAVSEPRQTPESIAAAATPTISVAPTDVGTPATATATPIPESAAGPAAPAPQPAPPPPPVAPPTAASCTGQLQAFALDMDYLNVLQDRAAAQGKLDKALAYYYIARPAPWCPSECDITWSKNAVTFLERLVNNPSGTSGLVLVPENLCPSH